MKRLPALILPLAALGATLPGAALAQPEAPSVPAPDAKAIFAQRYADLRKAMASGEADPILAILTPDFTFTDRRGQTRTADDMVSMAARMAMMGDPSDRKTTTSIASATIDGAAADVEQTTDTTMTREGRDGQTHQFEMISTSLDHWVQQDGVWRLQKETPKAMTLKRDGVEFQPGERRGGHGGPPPGSGN
ncbi:MAG: nuclear transport factor 2 family protein [Sphingomonadales bacterium]|nr:nuclear transport factor 2 family protein [Sphingomonadales bacterium]MDE2568998.1 nuclear transport factor 2 family protein [Sphingomonadales bacterium]